MNRYIICFKYFDLHLFMLDKNKLFVKKYNEINHFILTLSIFEMTVKRIKN